VGLPAVWRVAAGCRTAAAGRTVAEVPAVGEALLRPLDVCGRHSLEVFSMGCVAALFGRLLFRTFGAGLPVRSQRDRFFRYVGSSDATRSISEAVAP